MSGRSALDTQTRVLRVWGTRDLARHRYVAINLVFLQRSRDRARRVSGASRLQSITEREAP